MNRDAEIWYLFAPLFAGCAESFAERLGRTNVSPRQVARFLARHGLTTTIRRPLEEHDLWTSLPEPLVAEVRAARRRERILAVETLDLIAEIDAGLSEREIQHLFFKGPLLARRVYGGIDDRSVGDIDLLVPRQAIDRVEGYFLGAGYERRYGVLGGRILSRYFTHHLAHSRGRHMVEPHWTIAREPGLRLNLEQVWERQERVEVRDRRYPVPGIEHSLLIQCLTVIKDLALGTLRLRSVVDTVRVAEALQAGGVPEWGEVLSRFEVQGARRLATAALELSLRMLEVEHRFEELAAHLAVGNLRRLDRSDPTLGLRVFDLQPPGWENKRRLFPLYRGGALRAWAWWGASAPWRKTVYAD